MDGKEKKRGVKYCGISIPTVLISRLYGINKKLMVPTYFLTSFPVTFLNSGNEVGNNRNLCRWLCSYRDVNYFVLSFDFFFKQKQNTSRTRFKIWISLPTMSAWKNTFINVQVPTFPPSQTFLSRSPSIKCKIRYVQCSRSSRPTFWRTGAHLE